MNSKHSNDNMWRVFFNENEGDFFYLSIIIFFSNAFSYTKETIISCEDKIYNQHMFHYAKPIIWIRKVKHFL